MRGMCATPGGGMKALESPRRRSRMKSGLFSPGREKEEELEPTKKGLLVEFSRHDIERETKREEHTPFWNWDPQKTKIGGGKNCRRGDRKKSQATFTDESASRLSLEGAKAASRKMQYLHDKVKRDHKKKMKSNKNTAFRKRLDEASRQRKMMRERREEVRRRASIETGQPCTCVVKRRLRK